MFDWLHRLLCRWGRHYRPLYWVRGSNTYYRCPQCGRRWVEGGECGYTPVDGEWLAGAPGLPGEFGSKRLVPPRGGSGTAAPLTRRQGAGGGGE